MPENMNMSWSMDFVSDVLTNGRRFRVLNINDDFNRQAVAMEVGLSMPAEKVINTIERFDGSYRKSILDDYLFNNLNQVSELTEEWMNDYYEYRPHESLGDLSPKNYLKK